MTAWLDTPPRMCNTLGMSTTTTSKGEDMSVNHTTLRQIGGRDLLAISGGRYEQLNDTTLRLPVAKGYAVEVEYVRGRDLYTVRRTFRRGLQTWVKGTVDGVYADMVGEVAYRASCYEDGFGEAA